MNTLTLANLVTATPREKLEFVQNAISKRTNELEKAYERNTGYKLRLLTETAKEEKQAYKGFIKNSNECIKNLNNDIKKKVREEKLLKAQIEKDERAFRDVNPIVLKKSDNFSVNLGKLRGECLKIFNIECRVKKLISKYDSILYATVNEEELMNKEEVIELLKRQMSNNYLTSVTSKKICYDDMNDIDLYPYFKVLLEKKIIHNWNSQYKNPLIEKFNTDIYYNIMSYLIPITIKNSKVYSQMFDDCLYIEPLFIEQY